MKKAIIGISGVVILALAVVLFVNAGPGAKESKKATTELKSDCSKCPSASTCTEAEKAVKAESATATSPEAAPVCCDKEKSEAKSKACPEATATTGTPSCAAKCPMSKAAETK